jgi:hypothetical protein
MLLPMLAEWLCANNGKDARATRMVRDMHLFLIPTMNPDGFAKRRRKNRCAACHITGLSWHPSPQSADAAAFHWVRKSSAGSAVSGCNCRSSPPLQLSPAPTQHLRCSVSCVPSACTLRPPTCATIFRGGKDLNRNFPDRIKHAGTDLRLRQKGTQPETWAVMQFMLGKTWAGAANFHEGAEVGFCCECL